MKITGGSLKVREVLQSEKNTNAEKVNRIRIYSGENSQPLRRLLQEPFVR